jgi:Uma2 family endonuclease
MTMSSTTMLPYRKQGEIDYASLDFDPDVSEHPDDSMDQNDEMDEIMGLLRSRFTGFGSRPDVFLSRETNICYDPSNLNVRISPDIYLAFGVDAQAIRPRKLYLPWEAGKPPDWALEIASASTGRQDVNRKPAIYARIGVPEYWRFDPTGGDYHGEPLSGLGLVNGVYQSLELTTEPDGVLKGYSPVLELSLAWDEGWPRFYDPATGAYLENWRAEQAARTEAEARAAEAEAEARRLREQLRRLQPE